MIDAAAITVGAVLRRGPRSRTVLEIWTPNGVHMEIRRVGLDHVVGELPMRVRYRDDKDREHWCNFETLREWSTSAGAGAS